MKIALIGDLHFGCKSSDPVFMAFQSNYLNYFLNECKSRDVEQIIQLGDFFDNRKNLSVYLLNKMIKDIIPMVASFGIPWDVITGNHDIYYRDSNSVRTNILLESVCQSIFNIIEETKVKSYDGKKFFLSSWLNKNNTERILNEINKSDAQYCVGHFEPANVPMYSGSPLSDRGLDIDIFSKFKMVFSGHYHTASVTKNFCMLGSPYHLTWGDYVDGTNRGFFIFNTESEEIDFVENKEEHSLFKVFEYDNTKKYKESDIKDYLNCVVKIIIKSKENAKNFKDFKTLINSSAFIDYNFIDETILENKSIDIKLDEFDTDTVSTFSKYIDKQETQLDKHHLKEIASDVYNLAIQNGEIHES